MSIKTLLIKSCRLSVLIVLVGLIVFLILKKRVSTAHQQSIVCSNILCSGGNYFYDFQLNEDGEVLKIANLMDRRLLVKWLGRDLLFDIHRIDTSPETKPQHFAPALPSLRYIEGQSATKDDYFQLKSLVKVQDESKNFSRTFPFRFHNNLKSLRMSDWHSVDDLHWLAKFQNLEELHLSITDEKQLTPLIGNQSIRSLSINVLQDEELQIDSPMDFSIVSQIPNLRSLKIRCFELPIIESLSRHTNLERIELDLKKIGRPLIHSIPQVKSLSINGNKMLDLSCLEQFPNLEELSVSFGRILHTKSIENLGNLKKLHLTTDFDFDFSLSNLKHLESLGIFSREKIDLSSLPVPNVLQTLSVTRSKHLILPQFGSDSKLKSIFLDRCKKVTGMPKELPYLKKVHLTHSSVESIPKCPNLEEIFLDDCFIRNNENLKYCRKLFHYYSLGCNVSSLSLTKGHFHGGYLMVTDGPLSDVSELQNTNNLSDVSFKNTKVSDISPLFNNQHLLDLDLSETEFSSYDQLKFFPNLENMSLRRLKKPYDLKYIHFHPKLRNLSLVGTRIKNFSEVFRHKGLREIRVTVDRHTDFDLSTLKNRETDQSYVIHHQMFLYHHGYHWIFQPLMAHAYRYQLLPIEEFTSYSPKYIRISKKKLKKINHNIRFHFDSRFPFDRDPLFKD